MKNSPSAFLARKVWSRHKKDFVYYLAFFFLLTFLFFISCSMPYSWSSHVRNARYIFGYSDFYLNLLEPATIEDQETFETLFPDARMTNQIFVDSVTFDGLSLRRQQASHLQSTFSSLIEGHFPLTENEAVLSEGIADLYEIEIGDEITVTDETGKTQSYKVSGITQESFPELFTLLPADQNISQVWYVLNDTSDPLPSDPGLLGQVVSNGVGYSESLTEELAKPALVLRLLPWLIGLFLLLNFGTIFVIEQNRQQKYAEQLRKTGMNTRQVLGFYYSLLLKPALLCITFSLVFLYFISFGLEAARRAFMGYLADSSTILETFLVPFSLLLLIWAAEVLLVLAAWFISRYWTGRKVKIRTKKLPNVLSVRSNIAGRLCARSHILSLLLVLLCTLVICASTLLTGLIYTFPSKPKEEENVEIQYGFGFGALSVSELEELFAQLEKITASYSPDDLFWTYSVSIPSAFTFQHDGYTSEGLSYIEVMDPMHFENLCLSNGLSTDQMILLVPEGVEIDSEVARTGNLVMNKTIWINDNQEYQTTEGQIVSTAIVYGEANQLPEILASPQLIVDTFDNAENPWIGNFYVESYQENNETLEKDLYALVREFHGKRSTSQQLSLINDIKVLANQKAMITFVLILISFTLISILCQGALLKLFFSSQQEVLQQLYRCGFSKKSLIRDFRQSFLKVFLLPAGIPLIFGLCIGTEIVLKIIMVLSLELLLIINLIQAISITNNTIFSPFTIRKEKHK